MPARWRTGSTQVQSVLVESCWRPMVGDVAGDFHDVIDLRDGRVAVVVGDAPGFGPRAAAIAEDIRSRMRHAFYGTDDVRAVLAELDRALAAAGDEMIATAVLAVVDPAARAIQVANAGHLPVMITRNAGIEPFDGPADPPLGILAPRRLVASALPDGAALFLYTDGLIERRGTPLHESISALARACEGLGGAGAWASVLARRAVEEFGQPVDDATVVSVRLAGARRRAPAGPRRPAPVRVAVRVYLDPRDLRSRGLQAVLDDLGAVVEGMFDLEVEVVDLTSPASGAEEAGVLAAPTIVRTEPEPAVRVIGWFRSARDLAVALQLPFPKEDT